MIMVLTGNDATRGIGISTAGIRYIAAMRKFLKEMLPHPQIPFPREPATQQAISIKHKSATGTVTTPIQKQQVASLAPQMTGRMLTGWNPILNTTHGKSYLCGVLAE